jgi:hypothetical protein
MAHFLNVLRLANDLLLALISLNDCFIHICKPLMMFVIHCMMVGSTADMSSLIKDTLFPTPASPSARTVQVQEVPRLDGRVHPPARAVAQDVVAANCWPTALTTLPIRHR